jgi:hypothetical protein
VILETLGTIVIGVLAGTGLWHTLRREQRRRCRAFLYSEHRELKALRNIEGEYWQHVQIQGPRCKEFVDPRCAFGFCTIHCRSTMRCKGECTS